MEEVRKCHELDKSAGDKEGQGKDSGKESYWGIYYRVAR